MNMPACTLFNEQDKGSNLLSMINDLYWQNKLHKRKRLFGKEQMSRKRLTLQSFCHH